jgi:hypothetical protein
MRDVFLFISLSAYSVFFLQCSRFVGWSRSSTCKHQYTASMLRHSHENLMPKLLSFFTGMQVGVFRVGPGYRDVCTVRYFSPPAQVSAFAVTYLLLTS